MSKRVNQLLTAVMGGFTGAFLGLSAYVYWDYKTHPGLYAMQSAPWYTSILVYGAAALFVLLVCGLAKYILRKKRTP